MISFSPCKMGSKPNRLYPIIYHLPGTSYFKSSHCGLNSSSDSKTQYSFVQYYSNQWHNRNILFKLMSGWGYRRYGSVFLAVRAELDWNISFVSSYAYTVNIFPFSANSLVIPYEVLNFVIMGSAITWISTDMWSIGVHGTNYPNCLNMLKHFSKVEIRYIQFSQTHQLSTRTIEVAYW